jgi:hypothetical protein
MLRCPVPRGNGCENNAFYYDVVKKYFGAPGREIVTILRDTRAARGLLRTRTEGDAGSQKGQGC